ncbi:hypothetical protein [Actinomadura atramentaria]|uniref:hypothetical protein n=1 Tax=Actinomadura atramentaria TaxID=1990 RepID=UPI00035F89D5|nr:hypothetical protein [Actinomadura atramentaria]
MRRLAALALAAACAVPAAAAPALAAPSPGASREPSPSFSPALPSPTFPAYGYRRLDRVAAALARDPVYVDPDLSPWFTAADADRVRDAARSAAAAIGTPVYVVVAPNQAESESGGDARAFLALLRDRARRDGLYVTADSSAVIDALGFEVPRDLSMTDADLDDRPPDRDHRMTGLANRLVRVLDQYRDGRSVEPRSPYSVPTPKAFGEYDSLTPPEPETRGPFLLGLIVLGPLGVLVLWALFGIGRAVVRARSRRRGRPAGAAPDPERAPARPSVRWLRRTARQDLDALRSALADAAGDGDRAGLPRASEDFDAAQILLDDIDQGTGAAPEKSAERAMDLVGVIVLAREGRAALEHDTASPAPPCWVNPLHGPSSARRRVRVPGDTTGDGRTRRALCAGCAGAAVPSLAGRVLHVPAPAGPRRHFDVAGPWRDAAFGARTPLAPLVLEYLGVDD